MKIVEKFNNLKISDVKVAGGKGASLGEMTRSQIPIPPGFVVLSSVFDKFLEENKLLSEIEKLLKNVKSNDVGSIEIASKKITPLIVNSSLSEIIASDIIKEFDRMNTLLVAVRSSAIAEDSITASCAGELDSYLNVDKNGLLESIRNCWASLFTSRAIFYRLEKGLQEQSTSIAVVIQKMVQSDVSGIAFTVHPVSHDKEQVVIEAGYGLGEAIVGGIITPDTYIVSKRKREIIDKNISNQKMMIIKGPDGTKEVDVIGKKSTEQKISDSQIYEIAEICKNIEKHYNKPQDIEWAIENDIIYITQSRPITTL